MPIWIPDFSVILFWACAISLFYSFLGYPLLIGLLAKLISRRSAASEFESPPVPVSVILVVHNGKTLIGPRLENLLNQDHPIKEIIVICDGCTDGTPEAVQAVANPKVRTILQPRRSGKSSGLNLGIHNATSEIVVFADLRQRFRPDTISRLLENFANPEVGAVSGSLEIKASLDTTGRGVGSYWNLEKKLRHAESCFDSCIGCTGAIYASRLSLLEPIPEDTILDDVVIPMQIALAGYRVLFEPRAIAFDPQPQDPGLESIRKERTLAGNFQMLFRYPKWLLP